MIGDLLDRLTEFDLSVLVLITFSLAFGETVAFLDLLAPGEVGMVLVGAAADTPRRLVVVWAAGALGAFCGDSVSWFVGHRWGVAALKRWPRVWARTEPSLLRAEDFFARHGGSAIFTARFVGALRALAPLVAGSAKFPYRRFAPWNAAASIVWVGVVVTLGAVFGDAIADTADRAGLAISAVAVVAIVIWMTWRRRSRRSPATSVAATGP